jgi:hypothetical protein
MTEEQGQRIKAQLIELGLWGADDLGDLAGDIHDAGKLNDRLQAKLAEDVFLVLERTADPSWTHQVVIIGRYKTYKLLSAPGYIEAILLAAFALSEFLRQHPECAADQK